MIVFFKRNADKTTQPVVLLDYTRSDDQFSERQIRQRVQQAGVETGLTVNQAGPLSIFSLDYAVRYRHSAVNLADALKTSISISVSNAPPELSALVNVKQIVSQESALSLKSATRMVIDAQNQFPYGVLFIDIPSAGGQTVTVTRKFIIYGTTYNFDPKRINSKLQMRAASFEDMVMRIRLNMAIDKKTFLVDQIRAKLAASGYQVTPSDTGIATAYPVVERFYPPAPIARILASIAQDNGFLFDLDENKKTVKIQSLDPSNPPTAFLPKTYSFRGSLPAVNVISNFSVQDYATASFSTELVDVALFETVDIYDDSRAPDLFANFRARPTPKRGPSVYPFYVLEYEYSLFRGGSTVEIKATNNWLLSNFRLDTLFENAVYQGIQ